MAKTSLLDFTTAKERFCYTQRITQSEGRMSVVCGKPWDYALETANLLFEIVQKRKRELSFQLGWGWIFGRFEWQR